MCKCELRMKILLIFTLCLISDGGDSKEVTGFLGGEVLIKCEYDIKYTKNEKYFCKGSKPGCSDQIKTGAKDEWIDSGRFSLYDDTKSAEFRVMIRELTVQDAGTYHCGIDKQSRKDIYTPVELRVNEGLHVPVSTSVPTQYSSPSLPSSSSSLPSLSSSSLLLLSSSPPSWSTPTSSERGFPVSTVITVSASLLVLLIGIIVLIVTLHKRPKMQGSETIIHTSRDTYGNYENDPNVRNFQSTKQADSVCQSLDPNTNQSDSVYQSLDPNTNQSDSVYQSLDPNTNHSDSVYQSLDPKTNQSDSVYQSLDPNTNQSDSVYQSLDPNTNQSDSVYQSLDPNTNQSDSVYQSLDPNTNQSNPVYQSLKR